MFKDNKALSPAGYLFLVQHFDLKVMPHWHLSEIGGSKHVKTIEPDGRTKEVFPNSYGLSPPGASS